MSSRPSKHKLSGSDSDAEPSASDRGKRQKLVNGKEEKKIEKKDYDSEETESDVPSDSEAEEPEAESGSDEAVASDDETRDKEEEEEVVEEKKEKKPVKHRPIKYIDYPGFDAYLERWSKTKYAPHFKKLAEDGYLVIPKVATADFVAQIVKMIWDWLELWYDEETDVGPQRDDRTTWTAENFPPGVGGQHGINQWHEIGHTLFVWMVRAHPEIAAIFMAIWGCESVEDLVVSFDGMCMAPPSKRVPKKWPHTDQSRRRRGFWQVQGFLALTKQGKGNQNGCLCVRKGGHKVHAKLMEEEDVRGPKDWYKFTPEQMEKYYPLDEYPEVEVECDAGDFVGWLSTTPHFGRQCYETPLTKAQIKKGVKSEMQPITTPRFVVYVCMAPKSRMTEADIKKKTEFLESLTMTTHCPESPVAFGKMPILWSKENVEIAERRIAKFKAKAALRPDLVSASGADLIKRMTPLQFSLSGARRKEEDEEVEAVDKELEIE